MPSVQVTSAVFWPNGKIYFFSGLKYYRYTPDLAVQGPAGSFDDGYPLDIDPPPGQDRTWDRLPSHVQGAVVWPAPIAGKVKAYFFQYDRVWRYDVADDKVDDVYPRKTREEWPGLFPPLNDATVDTMVAWPPIPSIPPEGPKVFLFQRDSYYRYEYHLGTGWKWDNTPRLISLADGWPGLWTQPPHIRAGFVWPSPINGSMKAFFFQDDQFAQVDVATRKVDPGFPKLLKGNWPGFS